MISITSVDYAVLPTALLGLAKQHCRIDWNYDDDFVKSAIGRAIGKFEQLNEVTVNPTVVQWTPSANAFASGSATTPVRPVSAIAATAGEPPAPVTGYAVALKWDGIHGVPIQIVTGPTTSPAGLGLALTCGYADLNTLPPPVLDAVLRITAHLYEHREILVPGQEFVAPDWTIDATWWAPRA